MTIFNSKMSGGNNASVRGFTLVEIMVTLGLLGLVLAAIIPTFNFFGKSIIGLGNYTMMSQDSRRSLEILSRDFHMAETLLKAEAHEVTMVLPVDAGGQMVNYVYSPANGTVVRTSTPPGGTAVSNQLMDDVDEFSFVFFNRLGVELGYAHAPLLVETKSIQVNAKLLKKVISTDTSDYIISARFLMRNH